MSKKILVLGLGQNNFLSFLYAALKKFDATFSITVPFHNELTKDSAHDTSMYDKNDAIKYKNTVTSLLQGFAMCLFSKHFYETFFL